MLKFTFFPVVALWAYLNSPAPGQLQGWAVCNSATASDNVVVFLTGPQVRAPEPPGEPLVLDQRGLRFTPHVLPVVRGTTVAFPNSDPIRHNVFSASEARMFNLGTYTSGITRTVRFDKPGVVELLCNVHPEMSAYILVLETPYLSTTDQEGFFRIPKIPPGSYSLNLWCEHRGFLSRAISLEAGEIKVLQAVLHAGELTLARQVQNFQALDKNLVF